MELTATSTFTTDELLTIDRHCCGGGSPLANIISATSRIRSAIGFKGIDGLTPVVASVEAYRRTIQAAGDK